MIGRTASGRFVCLKCQLRLANSPTRSKLSTLRFGTQLRRNGTENRPRQDVGEPARDSSQPLVRRIAKNSQPRGNIRRPILNAKPKDVYRSKGQKLLAEQESLDIDILGKPAHAIVMRDGGVWRRRKPLAQEAAEEGEDVDVLEALDRESRDPTFAEVQRNIDELRPGKEKVLPKKDFDLLKDTLLHGFTTVQLNDYIRAKLLDEQPHIPGEDIKAPWVLEQWPWIPEVEDGEEAADLQLQGYVTKSTSPKERAVVTLMRQCWGISLQELLEGHGRLDLKLRDPEFSLLLLGSQRWLQSISRAFLKPGKQIELVRSQNLVRIVAPKATAETIVDELNVTLKSTVTKIINPTLFMSRRLDLTELDELGRVTNTYVRYGVSDAELLVSWIHLQSRDPNLEDLGDVVFRLLLAAFADGERLTSSTSVHPPTARSGWFVPDSSTSKRSWKSRHGYWGRWTDRTARSKSPTEKEPLSAAVLKHPLRVVTPPDPPQELGQFRRSAALSSPSTTSTLHTPASWPLSPVELTTAVFGQVLHPYTPSSTGGILGYSGTPPTSVTGIMSPVIPPLASLEFPTQLPRHEDGIILMRFLPDPYQFQSRGSLTLTPPPLELRLVTDDDGADYLLSLRAIIGRHITDVLQPGDPVDVRITHTRYFELSGRVIGELAGPVIGFVDRSCLKPGEGKLETPARLSGLTIPQRFMHPSTQRDGDADGIGEELVRVDYVFAGLELQRPVATEYDGWRLVYTNIEGGQGGGARAELSLEGIAAPAEIREGLAKSGARNIEEDGRDFILTVSNLSHGLGFKWASPYRIE